MNLPERITDGAGAVTLAMGVALSAAPLPTGSAVGLGPRAGVARALGAADLFLAPGLLGGRPRWPWMAARAGLNGVVTGCYLTNRGDRRATFGAVAMTTLVVVDGAVALALRRDRR